MKMGTEGGYGVLDEEGRGRLPGFPAGGEDREREAWLSGGRTDTGGAVGDEAEYSGCGVMAGSDEVAGGLPVSRVRGMRLE